MPITVSVYHANKPTFGFGDPPFNKNNFTLVALVEVPEDRSDEWDDWAFQCTNHIDRPWWENEGVTLVGEPKQRSTSVGDVVVRSDGKIFRCDFTGWTEHRV